jgi:hypothetical protein
LKFASKKEVRDRLKEFDAPDVAKFIDPDTIDKIVAARKPPLHQRGLGKNNKKDGPDPKAIQEEHRLRI